MENELYVGQQKILFDREATVALYRHTIVVPGADQCTCIPCKNFAAQRGKVFPEEFRQLLTELGVDPLKEWEAFDYNFDPKNPRKQLLYGGWFLFAGELVEGLDKRPHPEQKAFAHWFTTSFPAGTLPTGLKLWQWSFLLKFLGFSQRWLGEARIQHHVKTLGHVTPSYSDYRTSCHGLPLIKLCQTAPAHTPQLRPLPGFFVS